MASLVNSVRNIATDKLWFIKIIFLALPLYFYFSDKEKLLLLFQNETIFFTILGFFYLGISSVMANRNIQNKSPLLPSFFDVFEVLKQSIGSCISAFSGIILLIITLYFVQLYVSFEDPFVKYVVVICISLILFPFICIPVILYSARCKISDGIKVFKIYNSSGNFIVEFLSYLIQFLLIIVVFTYVIYKTIDVFLNANAVAIASLYAFMSVLSFLSVFSWASDLYGDVIPEVEQKRKKSKLKR